MNHNSSLETGICISESELYGSFQNSGGNTARTTFNHLIDNGRYSMLDFLVLCNNSVRDFKKKQTHTYIKADTDLQTSEWLIRILRNAQSLFLFVLFFAPFNYKCQKSVLFWSHTWNYTGLQQFQNTLQSPNSNNKYCEWDGPRQSATTKKIDIFFFIRGTSRAPKKLYSNNYTYIWP